MRAERVFHGLPAIGFALALAAATWSTAATAEEAQSLVMARNSIDGGQLRRHVTHLADDVFEGRETGSRGGRAAGVYLGQALSQLGLAGAGGNQGYYQPFGEGSRNLLAMLEGSDPALKQEIILIGAHYDHVGYGSAVNSFGPLGRIHNGADDNGSGTAGLLELAQAFSMLEPRPKRSLLFVLWDGEEEGLLGSKHWTAHPTVPLARVKFAINMDMIGRLNGNRLEFTGSRTAPGLRQLVSRHNRQHDLLIDFPWEIKDNSDHHPFFSRRIPILMPFTGLHDDYHRPSDDADKINVAGMQQITRLMFDITYELAEMPRLPPFRPQSEQETPTLQKLAERPLAPLPGRLGVSWHSADDASAGVRITSVAAGSPAEIAGIHAGDRLVRMGSHLITSGELLRSLVLLADGAIQVALERTGEGALLEREVTLVGRPVRLGISWRLDDAEPAALVLTRVVGGSPADVAGLRPNDRILELDGQAFADGPEFQQLSAAAASPLRLTMERNGQTRIVELTIPGEAKRESEAATAKEHRQAE
jgi:hypothetical protein